MLEFEKDPGETLEYEADFEGHCARYRWPNMDYATNVVVRPLGVTGFQYKATVGGRSARAEPRWPEVAAQTVKDGSITWTAEAVTADSLLRTLSSAAWTGDAGITLAGGSTSGVKSNILISGGTEGQSYDVVCTGTCSDGTYPVITFTVHIRRPARAVGGC